MEHAPFTGDVLKMFYDPATETHRLVMVDESADIPSAVAGYAVGCMLFDLEANTFYYNSGTASSCTFSTFTPGSAPGGAVALELNDGVATVFGDDADASWYWDNAASTLFCMPAHDDTEVVQIGDATHRFANWTWLFGAGTEVLTVDAGNYQLEFKDVDLYLGDNDILNLGGTMPYSADGGDVTLRWVSATSTFQIKPKTHNTACQFGTVGRAFDITFWGNTLENIAIDSAANTLTSDGIDFQWNDDDITLWGDDGDMKCSWDGTNFVWQPKTDDTGVFTIGNSTAPGYYCDFQMMMGASTSYVLFDNDAQLVYVEATDIRFGDDDILELGDGGTASLLYETADANANCLILELPAGGATDVPVFVVGQAIENVDLTLFNGVTETRVAVLDAAHTSYVSLGFSAAATPAIAIGGGGSPTGLTVPNVLFPDGVEATFGGVATLFYDVTDANANCLKLEFPAGGGTDVPVLIAGIAIDGVDLGFFNGSTEPAIALVDAALTSWFKFDFSAAATPRIAAGGAATAIAMANNVTLSDGLELSFGGVTTLFHDTTDANANHLKLEFPAGGGTDVPVLSVGIAIDGVDLGFFNGSTEPAIALIDAATTSWFKFDFSAAATPRIAAGGVATTVGMANNLTFADDIEIVAGTGADCRILFETADANANELIVSLPAAAGNSVPVLAIGHTIATVDLALFDAATQSTLALIDADHDSYLALDYSADDTPRISVGGSATALSICALTMLDSAAITQGTGSDAVSKWNGTYYELGPATGMWAGCPNIAYPDESTFIKWSEDFISISCDDTTGYPTGWFTYVDVGGTFTLPAAQGAGGFALLTTAATNNNEMTIQLGGAHTGQNSAEAFAITNTSNKKFWFECVVKADHTQDGMVAVGLAQGGAAAGGDVLADDTGTLKDIDIVCFRFKQDAPTEWDFAWRKNGQAEQEQANIATNAGAYHTFGCYFDGTSTLTPYADGVAKTGVDVSAATFPSGEEVMPIITVKTSAAAGVASTFYVDRIKCVQMR